ncbi:MAG: pyridoxal-dependent decarboxylase, partial [Cyanobacteria bacterium P01_E01_bin.42]
MQRSQLPKTAFIDPLGGNRAEIEQLFQQVLELVLNHLHNAGDRSPLPSASSFPNKITIPDTPLAENEIVEQLQSILAGAMNAANPAFIGHMDSIPTTFSILGEAIAAAINNNMLSLEMSPIFSRLESHLLAELAALSGLGTPSGGVLFSGGSLANLQALAVARNVKF